MIDKIKVSNGGQKVRVYYKGRPNRVFDRVIRNSFTAMGYAEIASGYNLVDGVRDFLFERTYEVIKDPGHYVVEPLTDSNERGTDNENYRH